MVTLESIRVSPFERRHKQAAADLLFYGPYFHSHLDWQTAEDWLTDEDAIIYLAWSQGQLIGLLGASAPLNRASWIRVTAVQRGWTPRDVLLPLWESISGDLRQQGTALVGWLLAESWQQKEIAGLGFAYYDEIITLRRTGHLLPEGGRLPGLRIREAERTDLDKMATVDQAAFSPPWQMTRGEVRQGSRIGASTTVAEYEDALVGYQISTLYHNNAHLARLAVLPEMQGKGIGGALLAELITYFLRRRVQSLTVNTQATNVRSQRLYERFGFVRNGYDLPVWAINL